MIYVDLPNDKVPDSNEGIMNISDLPDVPTKDGSIYSRKFHDLKKIIQYNLKWTYWPVCAIPFLFCILAALPFALNAEWATQLEQSGIFDDIDNVAPWILMVALGVSSLRLITQRHVYFLWTTIFVLTLLCREYRWWYSVQMVKPILVAMLIASWLFYGSFREYFGGRLVLTVFPLVFICYMLSQTLDKHWWKSMPNEIHWRSFVEESVEVLGHLFMLSMVLTRRVCTENSDPEKSDS